MTALAVLVGETNAALDALAEVGNLKIMDGTRRQFVGVTTFSTPTYMTVGAIDTGDSGWIALARPIGD